MQLLTNKYSLIDMATAMDSIPTFEGKDKEEIITWFNELDLISKISEFDEVETLKFTLLKLRGKPREWTYMEISKDEKMTFHDLKQSLAERFIYESGITRNLNEIFRMVPIENISSFEKFIQKANLAFKWNAVTEKNLIELVVRRGPKDLDF